MSCRFSKELLALHAEGDLPGEEAIRVSKHLIVCLECRQFIEELQESQSALKTLRQETCRPEACVEMRREVMSVIRDSESSPKWPVRMERAVLSGLRRRGFALASLAMVTAMVSGLLLIQLRLASVNTSVAAVFDAERLVLPDGYREWTPLARGAMNVYIDPAAYREFVRTGVFPDGTVIVREAGASSIQVSVKDGARFDDEWEFFEFSREAGALNARPAALAADVACRACHERNAGTDHVFTQFYPELRRSRGQSS